MINTFDLFEMANLIFFFVAIKNNQDYFNLIKGNEKLYLNE